MSNSHSEFRAEVIIATSATPLRTSKAACLVNTSAGRTTESLRSANGGAIASKGSKPGKSFRVFGAEPFVGKAQPGERVPAFEVAGRNLHGRLDFRGDFAAFHARGNTVLHRRWPDLLVRSVLRMSASPFLHRQPLP